MAQAVRLKLRMQKELKLLLADPPHGASFPFLSADSDLTDLTSIDARIEGPEASVYANGVFKIKIQIPERYPLQPPIVTFGTPIYHPNIDNGGRICLDILNLPPKGAWQPSLNIWTVLTSIRLLLSEPNPDDGLMCEASKEYKYNRQAFDHKARSMTEKFAKAGAGESSCTNQSPETNTKTKIEVQGLDLVSKHGADELIPSHEKPRGISQRLSLESASSNKKKDSDLEVNEEVPNPHLPLSDAKNHMEGKRKREKETDVLNECNLNHEKSKGNGKKSALKSSNQFEDDFDNKENVDPNYLLSLCQHRASSGSSAPQASGSQQLDQHQDSNSANTSIKRSSKHCQSQKQPFGSMDSLQTCENVKLVGKPQDESVSAETKPGKLSSVGKKLSLGLKRSSNRQQDSNKENNNMMGIHNSTLSKPQSPRKNGLGRKLSLGLGPLTRVQLDSEHNEKQQCLRVQSKGTEVEIKQKGIEEKEESPTEETVIVLDSEDSEEEGHGLVRSKTQLARRRLGKWRVKA